MNQRFGSQNRPYAQSHPWISFVFELQRLTSLDFVRLGEAMSSCDHISGVPLPPVIADQLHIVYLVKGIHATTQIEGNTLTEDEVRAQVDGDLNLPESRKYLGKEIENILAACNLVANELATGRDMRLTTERIELFNKMVLDGLPEEDGVIPGEIRTKGVGVGNVYLGAPAGDCRFLLDQLCAWLEQLTIDAGEDWRQAMGIIRAVLAHLYLAWIHPFGNGNGRTARLVEFQLLMEAGFPSPACHLLSNYYNKTRTLYYQVLKETSRAKDHPVWKFVSYALRGFVEELRDQLQVIKGHQLGSAWVNYVHEANLGSSQLVAHRRRALILALDEAPTPISGIRRLTPELAEAYAGKTSKTITRDVNCLVEAGLLERRGQRVRPRLEQLLAFLPLCKPSAEAQESAILSQLAAASQPLPPSAA